jgi:hypothetical protein
MREQRGPVLASWEEKWLYMLKIHTYAQCKKKKRWELVSWKILKRVEWSPIHIYTYTRIKAWNKYHPVLLLYLRVISAMSERERGKGVWLLKAIAYIGEAKANESEWERERESEREEEERHVECI